MHVLSLELRFYSKRFFDTCLDSMAAEAFMIVADRIEAGEEPLDIAADLLKQHEKCVFNGNGYDPNWRTKP